MMKYNLQLFADEDKTEPASPKKREDLKKKGQTYNSRDLTMGITLLVGVMAVKAMSGFIFNNISESLYFFFNKLSNPLPYCNSTGAFNVLKIVISRIITISMPLALIVCVIGIMVNIFQSGFIFTTNNLKFDLNRINPAEGFKRIFSKKALVELAKSLLKVILVGYVIYSYLSKNYTKICMVLDMETDQILKFMWESLLDIGMKAGTVLMIIGAIDYVYQRWDFEQSIRMSKEEVKEEYKETEGNPQTKSRIRENQRKISTRRMMEDVKKAAVVITNPTHIAVALMYDNAKNDAPIVIGKGVNKLAQKIKKIAGENNIPVVEDVKLAHLLYEKTDIGEEIPPELYKAVAEILAYIYSLNN